MLWLQIPLGGQRGSAEGLRCGGGTRPGATWSGLAVVSVVRRIVRYSIRESTVGRLHLWCALRRGGRWPPIVFHDGPGAVIDAATPFPWFGERDV